jgi:hypothetical protein
MARDRQVGKLPDRPLPLTDAIERNLPLKKFLVKKNKIKIDNLSSS